MINTNKLKGKIVENGLNIHSVAKAIGVDTSTLYRKIKSGGSKISIREADAIVKILGLTPSEATDIFFSQNVA